MTQADAQAIQVKILGAINHAQSLFIANTDKKEAFDQLLADLLALTESEYGFIGEVLRTPEGDPYLKTHAITNIAWNAQTRAFYDEHAPKGMEFFNLKSLFGTVLTTAKPVIANDPYHDPRRGGLPEGHPPLNAFLGIPILIGERMVAMAGMSNRPGGYDQDVIDLLQPLLMTIGQLVEAHNNRLARQAAEAAHAQTSAFLTSVLDAASEISIIATDPQGIITEFNSGAVRLLGYSAEEIVGKQTPAIFHLPAEVEARGAELTAELGHPVAGFRIFVEIPEQQGSEHHEWTYVRKSGEHVPVSLVVTAMRADNGEITGYLGIAQNIAERNMAEAALRENEQRFRDMLDTCPTAARIARSGGHEVVFSNPRYAELINTTKNQVTGVDPVSFYANPQDYADILQRLGKGENILDKLVELRIPNSENKWALASYFPIQYEGSPAVLGWFYDITDRKHNEIALAEQASHTQAILDHMVDGLITIDQRGIIASFNLAAERIFGYQAEEVLGQNVKMLMPNPHRDAHDSYLHNYQTTGVARVIGIGREVEGLRKDGSLFPMELAVSEVSRQDTPLYVGMVRDITERKRMERMKTEFVSTVSHELRTPLTSISGALGLLSGGALGNLPDQARSLIDIAHKNSKRLTHLINDLLDMEKIAAGKMHFDMQPQPLLPLIEQSLEGIRSYGVERRVSFALDQQLAAPQVRVDNQRLLQVLSNLLSNAVKYSPEGGTVDIAVRQAGNQVRVEVADHGPGIPAEFRSRIFQKFSQADSSDTRQKGGTGLGLAITRELVERMGGHIGFKSEEGKGARFYFELPLWNLNDRNPADDLHLPTPSDEAPRILVVEDEPDIAKLLGMMLTRAGYAVDTAMNGTQALQALEQSSYAAMTLDLMLPDIGGLEIIRQVRQTPKTSNLPIIVVSAKMEEGKLAINGDFSGIDWMAKPIDEARLLSAVGGRVSGEDGQKLRVLHVEDDADMHQVIRAMVGDRCEFTLATTLADAKNRVANETFDVVILDLGLPDGSGWDILPILRARQPSARIIILSGADITPNEIKKVEAVLLKSRVSSHDLLQAIQASIIQSKLGGSL